MIKKGLTGVLLLLSMMPIAACSNTKKTSEKTTTKITTTAKKEAYEFSSGTTLANIDISGLKSEEELKNLIKKGYEDWVKTRDYKFVLQNIEFSFSDNFSSNHIIYDYFELDYEKTRSHLLDGFDNKYYFSVIEPFTKEIGDAILNKYTGAINSYISTTVFRKAFETVLLKSATLENECIIDLAPIVYSLDKEHYIPCIITVPTENADRILEAFNYQISLAPCKIEDKKCSFSLLDYLNLKNNTLTQEDMSIVATGIAGVLLRTNFDIPEITFNQEPKYYSYQNMSVLIDKDNNIDLKIINNETTYYSLRIEKISTTGDNSTLSFKLYGVSILNVISNDKASVIYDYDKTYVEEESHFNYEEELANNPNLVGIDLNYQGGCYYKIIQEGVKTIKYKYYRDLYDYDGNPIDITATYTGQDEIRIWTKDGYSI